MKLKENLLAFAIAVLTIFVAFYGVNTFFPSVDYDDYCGDYRVPKLAEDEATCVGLGGEWVPQDIKCITEPCVQGFCDFFSQCQEEYDSARESRGQKVFFVALPLAIILILIGAFVFGIEAVGTGIIGGGIGTLIYGSGAFWPYTENWIRFLISLIGLVVLIWLIYYFSRKGKKKRK